MEKVLLISGGEEDHQGPVGMEKTANKAPRRTSSPEPQTRGAAESRLRLNKFTLGVVPRLLSLCVFM